MKRENLLGILMNVEDKRQKGWLPDMVMKEKILDGHRMKWQSFWIPCSDTNEDSRDIDREYINRVIDRLETEKIISIEE